MTPTALDLALDLMSAKHPDNPDAPASMVRAGCAAPLAKALWDLGWRRQTTTSAPGTATPVESTPAPSTSGASAPTSAEVVHLPERPCPTCTYPSRETVNMVCQTCGWDYSKGEKR